MSRTQTKQRGGRGGHGGNGDDGDNTITDVGRHGSHGGGGDDTISGGDKNDKLWGDAGDDHLVGGGGSDTLTGGLGADVLTGGAGRDTFVLGSLAEANGDHVTDYDSHGRDRLKIDWGHLPTTTGGTDGGDDDNGTDTGSTDDNGTDTGGTDDHGTHSGGDDGAQSGLRGAAEFLGDHGHAEAAGRGHGGSDFSFIGHDAFTGAGQVRVEGGNGEWTVSVNVDSDLHADYSFTVTTVDGAELTARDFHL